MLVLLLKTLSQDDTKPSNMDTIPNPPSSPLSVLPPSSPLPYDPDLDSPPHTPRPHEIPTPRAAQDVVAETPPFSPLIARKRGDLVGAEGSDPGVEWSSPAQNTDDRKRKGYARATASRKQYYEKQAEEARDKQERAVAEREGVMEQIIKNLNEARLTVADLVAHAFHPQRYSRQWRWDQFFSKPEVLRQFLQFCISSDVPPSVRSVIQTFAYRYVLGCLKQEADAITRGSILRVTGRSFDA